MNYLKYFLLFIVAGVLACSQNEVQQEGVRTIELKESKDVLPVSSFIKKLDYTKLENPNNKYQIGEIQDVKVLGGDIILRHRMAKKISIVRYTKNGQFINVVVDNQKSKVKQPLDIIQYKNDFAVLGKSGIFVFSKDGEFKKQLVKAAMPGSRFFYSENNFFVTKENSFIGDLAIYGVDGKSEKSHKNDVQFDNPGVFNVLSFENDTRHWVSAMNDTIFKTDNEFFKPEYIYFSNEFPTLMEGIKHIMGMERMDARKYMNNNQHIVVKNFLENKNFIFITYWAGSNASNVLINKKTWEHTYFSYGVNNIDGGIWDRPFYLSENNELYIPVKAAKISGHKIRNKYRKDFEKLQQQISPSDGPVIMRCKLK